MDAIPLSAPTAKLDSIVYVATGAGVRRFDIETGTVRSRRLSLHWYLMHALTSVVSLQA